MAAPSSRETVDRRLLGLDLARGVAALAVLVYHVDFMFGLRKALVPGGYTAVDLFFVLSGFVIAKTYEGDIRSGRIGAFGVASRRLARLYPLYALTLLVGVVVMTARFHSNFGRIDAPAIAVAAFANLFVAPTPIAVFGGEALFPFNAASWSIFYELAVNAVFFVVFARLNTRGLVCLWLASGIGLAFVAIRFAGVDVGWGAPNVLAGFPRVCFSFLSGMLVWRRYQVRPWTAPVWALAALIAVHLALMQLKLWIPASLVAWSDLAIVAVLAPAIVSVGVGATLGPLIGRIGSFLGDISYAVYLTQDALIIAAAGFTQAVLGAKIYDFAPIAGLLFVPLCVAESYFVYRWFEAPARAWLRRASGSRRAARQAAALSPVALSNAPQDG